MKLYAREGGGVIHGKDPKHLIVHVFDIVVSPVGQIAVGPGHCPKHSDCLVRGHWWRQPSNFLLSNILYQRLVSVTSWKKYR